MFELVPFRRRGCSVVRRGDSFENILNSFFDSDLEVFENTALKQKSFEVDIQENDDSYILKADVPGVKKEDIDITYENNYLTISTKRDEVNEEKKADYVRRERSSGKFARSFYIDNVDIEKTTASFKNGVLTVSVAKNKANAKKVDIN